MEEKKSYECEARKLVPLLDLWWELWWWSIILMCLCMYLNLSDCREELGIWDMCPLV